MDGQVFTRPLQPRRFVLNAILMIVAGLLPPAVAHAQAMGKAQVDSLAVAHVDPPALPVSAGTAMPPSHEDKLLAMSGDSKIAAVGDKSADDKSIAPAKVVADGDIAKNTKSTAIKVDAPAGAVPETGAATDPTATKAAGAAAAPSDLSPHISAIESSLIKPSTKAVTPPPTPTENAPVAPPAQTSLYARFTSIGQVAAALLVVVGLILIGRALVRKFVPGAAAGTGKGVMEILARYPLAKNQSLVLVRIGSQLVVLNQTREASQSVMVISDQVEVANILGQIQGAKPRSIQEGFSNLLANARMDLESEPPNANEATIEMGDLDSQLDEMAAAKRQLMELRQQVRSVRESLPIG
jgi:flagellar biogenesis protein FliO